MLITSEQKIPHRRRNFKTFLLTGSWCWKGGGAACALQDVCTPTGCSGDDNDNSDDDVGEDDDNDDDGDDDDDDDDNDGAGQVEVSVDVQQLWT